MKIFNFKQLGIQFRVPLSIRMFVFHSIKYKSIVRDNDFQSGSVDKVLGVYKPETIRKRISPKHEQFYGNF